MKPSRITWRNVAKLFQLDAGERRLLLAAFLKLLAVDLALRTVGFARTRGWLGGASRVGRAESAGAERWAEVETVAWAVAAAARHHLYPMRCLARSLAIQALLARRGIGCELRIGVRREPTGALRSHAWLECLGRAVTEPEDIEERFSSLALPAP
jgi:hypothetical protein